MESVDRCRGKMREDTCESLQLMLLKEEFYIKNKARLVLEWQLGMGMWKRVLFFLWLLFVFFFFPVI